MNLGSQLLVVNQDCAEAVAWATHKMSLAGLTVVRTFDLQTTRHLKSACPCPDHGMEECDCQMVVLLVYKDRHQPVSLIAHGYNSQTWFSVVDIPEQRPDPALELSIRRAFPSSLVNYP